MFTIFLRTIKDKKVFLTAYCVAGVLLMWMIVAIYPTIYERAAEFQELFSNYPEGILKALGVEEVSLDTLAKFLEVEVFSFMWPIMAILLLFSIAGSALAKEIEKGTIENLLAKPVSRLQVFFAQYFVGVVSLILFIIFSLFSVFPLAELYNIGYSFEPYFRVAIITALFGLAIFSMAMMFSAFVSERSKVYMAAGVVLLFMYVANIASALVDKLESLKYISFFYYFDHQAALVQNELNIFSIIVFLLVAIVCTIIGAVWFKKRDIAI